MSVLLFFLVLFVLVLVHEWGHFIVAKKTGMRVDEFGIGFPPKLFGRKKGETEYSFNMFPIGGFVRIFGENAEAPMTEEDKVDEHRAFYNRPKLAQAAVLLAGITMNILFAWLLFSIVLVVGVPTAVDEATASPEATLVVASTLKDAPADGALPVGATITKAVSGADTLEHPTPETFSTFVSGHAPAPIDVTYIKKGEEKTIAVVPKAGLVKEDPSRYIIGTSLALVEMKRESLLNASIDAAKMTASDIVTISAGLYGLAHDALFGKADLSSVAGPVGIVGMVGDAASYGLTPLLMFTAMISLNLAVINVLPFPALDGGRLVFVLIEAITKRHVPAVWTGWINLLGFALLMVLMAAVTIHDISRLF
jgi:regulator of sigma E protease